jgi:uncharacterized membrane protein
VNSDLLIVYGVRWVHIVCATLAIGGPFFVRFALLPAAGKVLDEATHQRLRAAVNARWAKVVYVVITLFILTGLYQFLVTTRVNGVLVTGRWRDFSPADRKVYHMIFGIKMMAAFTLFFLASALAGRSEGLAVIRRKAGVFLGVLLVLAAVVVACSTMLRYLPMKT